MATDRHSNHPFYYVAKQAELQIVLGNTIYQKFTCAKCGTRQTIEEPNKFFKTGRCEECGHTTDIVATGCNFLMVRRFK